MAKKKPKPKPKPGKKGTQRSDRQYQRATRNVQLQNQPSIDQLNSMMQQAQQDFQRSSGRASSITGGYNDTLAGLPQTDYGQIADDFTQRLGSLQGMFQGGGPDQFLGQEVGMPNSEVQAASNLGQAYGAGGLESLSSFGAREGAARESAGREGALSGRYLQENLMKGFQDTLQGYQNQLSNINAKTPSQIDMEQDQLRQQGIENQLAQSKMDSDAAFSQYLQDQLGNMASSNPRRNPNNTGNNGNGNQGNRNQNQGNPGGYDQNHTVPNPHDYHQRPGPQVPAAWQRADEYGQLPGLVKHAYNRPKGTSLQESFQQSNHPSFNNFGGFQDAYQAFKHQINQLYQDRPNPGVGPGRNWRPR